MAYLCPHCGSRSIGFLAKWWSGSFASARCAACGEHAEVNSTTARGCSGAALAVAGISVLLFVRFGHLAVLGVGLLAAAGVYLAAYHLVPLQMARQAGWKFGRPFPITLFGIALLLVAWAGRNL